MKRFIILILAAASPLLHSCSESSRQGWYDAPWTRYEAEADACSGKCLFLEPSGSKRDVQSEATHQTAASLVNSGDYVEWTCREAADGMVIRFSVPDSPQGGGTKGNVALYVGNDKVCDIELDSYHAWQWKRTGCGPFNWYYDNTPGEDKYARMAFDEKRVLLDSKIKKGERFRLVKTDDNTSPYTIDFVELEDVPAPVAFDEADDGNAVCYDASEGTGIAEFIARNQGKTIYIPAGRHESPSKIVISASDTKLIGAGPWYTEIHYTADPNDPTTDYDRGISAENKPDNVAVKGIYFGASLDRRYLNYHNPETGLCGIECGVGFLGDFGDNFIMDNLWIEHLECGTWIESFGKDSRITHCRIRNNYADGLNFEEGDGLVVEKCNCRNNGDDQIATHWRNLSDAPINTIIRNCTIELGWRAGGMAVVSGYNLHISNLHIEDHFENGIRFLSEFPGHIYGGNVVLSDITMLNCGCAGGDPAEYGTFEGDGAAVLHFSADGQIDIRGITLKNIDIINPRSTGIRIGNSGGCRIDCVMENVTVRNWTPSSNGQQYHAISFAEKASGEFRYSNLTLDGDEASKIGDVPSTVIFEEIKK